MYITLMDEKSHKQEILNFDPDSPLYQNLWRAQNKSSDFLPGLKTGLRRPFDQVFIKRLINRKAPAHELLKTVRGKMLPGTPRIFGVQGYGANSLYVYEFMAGDTLNNVLMSKNNYLAFLTPDLL